MNQDYDLCTTCISIKFGDNVKDNVEEVWIPMDISLKNFVRFCEGFSDEEVIKIGYEAVLGKLPFKPPFLSNTLSILLILHVFFLIK